MKPPLTKEERESLFPYATKEQLDFLLNHVKQGFKTKFLNIMADIKVTLVRSQDVTLVEIEKDASSWILEDYIDYGKGNYLGRCACNRKLRRVFTVKHVLDELLIKIKENQYGYEILEDLDGMEIPEDIQAHINANVPLLDRQINRLYRKLREIERNVRKQQEESLMKALLEEKNRMLQQIEREHRRLEAIVEKVRQNLPPNPTKEMIALQLVFNGFSSTLEICHILIDYFGQDGSLSAGVHKRPRIFPSILQHFLEQTEKGNLILMEKIGVEDCIFIPNEYVNIRLEMEDTIEENNEGEEQLTLFL